MQWGTFHDVGNLSLSIALCWEVLDLRPGDESGPLRGCGALGWRHGHAGTTGGQPEMGDSFNQDLAMKWFEWNLIADSMQYTFLIGGDL